MLADARFVQSDADRLGNQITELYAYISAATRQFLVLIREFDEHECWARQGFLSCAHWLNFHCGLGKNAAGDHAGGIARE